MSKLNISFEEDNSLLQRKRKCKLNESIEDIVDLTKRFKSEETKKIIKIFILLLK